MLGRTLAVLAGMFASLASVCAKFAMAQESTLEVCASLENCLGFPLYCTQVVTYVRALCFITMFGCNALMWTLFVKALQKCASSLEATITNTSSNLLFTAFFGKVLFGEALSLMWWFGAILIIIGLALVHTDTHQNEKEKDS